MPLAVVFTAIGVAIGAWLRPLPKTEPSAAPSYSSQQVAEAKAKVCAAYTRVHRAVGVNMAREPNNDPTTQLAIATSARQALVAGSIFLQATLSDEPATPVGLASALRKLINIFQSLTVDYLNGLGSPEIDPTLRAGDDITSNIEQACS
ncbi:hypothetical protein [Mycobacterium asiaticum]|uniref:hypothetical protein n=1 Tax=Mycobacterium asiaticum TaxID=1790 RepID=UPI0012DB76A9|nr:hypothetical protein [Mycobacterium asiaticum]